MAADAWYAGAVNWAAAQGIVAGYDTGAFGPEDAVTREQLAAMLYRYCHGTHKTKLGYLERGGFICN
ncbi:MAG: S-layer homology domain-containing protein [Flavonifractor plautii]